MKTTHLIVITVPPQPTREAIQSLREPLCRTHNAGWALQYPPHVTLRTGVIVPDEKLSEVFSAFGRLLAETPPFTITTDSPAYGRMEYENENHFFLYFPVRMDAALAGLNRRLLTYRDYRKSDKQTFFPHLTLLWGGCSNARGIPDTRICRQQEAPVRTGILLVVRLGQPLCPNRRILAGA